MRLKAEDESWYHFVKKKKKGCALKELLEQSCQQTNLRAFLLFDVHQMTWQTDRQTQAITFIRFMSHRHSVGHQWLTGLFWSAVFTACSVCGNFPHLCAEQTIKMCLFVAGVARNNTPDSHWRPGEITRADELIKDPFLPSSSSIIRNNLCIGKLPINY